VLKRHEWPGNVRELRNRVQRAIIMSDASVIEPDDLGCEMELPELDEEVRPVVTLREARERVERELLVQAMDRQNGNIARAAEELGVSRPTFYDMMKKHCLMPVHGGEKGGEP